MQKDLIPDEHDGEKVKEELDGGARSAQDRQQVYNKAWLRRTREAAHTSTVRIATPPRWSDLAGGRL